MNNLASKILQPHFCWLRNSSATLLFPYLGMFVRNLTELFSTRVLYQDSNSFNTSEENLHI